MSALAQLHVARKQLGLDEDTYRDALERATGRRSAKDMSEIERKQAIQYFKGKGFMPAPGRKRSKLAGPFSAKLQALWIGAWNLALVRNRDDAALLAFVKRQTGIDHTRFLKDADDAYKAVEALKSWMAREGGVDWAITQFTPNIKQLSGYKIARAQFVKLHGEPFDPQAFFQAVITVSDRAHGPAGLIKEEHWHSVMNAFGHHVRAVPKEGDK